MTHYKHPVPTELHHVGAHARDFRTVLIGFSVIGLFLLLISGWALWAWIVTAALLSYPIILRVRTVRDLRSGRLDEGGYRW